LQTLNQHRQAFSIQQKLKSTLLLGHFLSTFSAVVVVAGVIESFIRHMSATPVVLGRPPAATENRLKREEIGLWFATIN
jgi:hypothetical protein